MTTLRLAFVALTLAFALVVVIAVKSQNIYVTKVVVNKPFDVVWAWVSDPLKYPTLYPYWAKRVTRTGVDFHIEDQFGGSYDMKRLLNKDSGTVDLFFGQESSRARLYPLKNGSTAIVHLAQRWEGLSWIQWLFFMVNVDRDFRAAKRAIEVR